MICPLIESHPRAAPWVAGFGGAAVYALLTPWIDNGPLLTHALEIAAVALALFFVVRWKSRHPARW